MSERIKRIKAIVRMIEALDSCRIGRTSEYIRFERELKNTKISGLPVKPKTLRKVISEINEMPRKDPKYSTVVKLNKLSSILSLCGLVISVVSMLLVMVLRIDSMLYYVTLASLLMIFYASYMIRWYSDERVIKIYSERVDELMAKGEPIKKVIEFLLDEIRREARRGKIDLNIIQIHLHLPDYKGVKILKKPGKLRTRYVVTLTS